MLRLAQSNAVDFQEARGELCNIPVSYKINAGTPVTETIPGPISPNATATYTFTTKANLSVAGLYTIVASTNLVGDGLAINDTFTKSLTSVQTVATFPYSENFDAGNKRMACR